MIRTTTIALAALLASCGGGGSSGGTPAPVADDFENPFTLSDDPDENTIADCADDISATWDRFGGLPGAIDTFESPARSSHTYRYPGVTIEFAWGASVNGCEISERTF